MFASAQPAPGVLVDLFEADEHVADLGMMPVGSDYEKRRAFGLSLKTRLANLSNRICLEDQEEIVTA